MFATSEWVCRRGGWGVPGAVYRQFKALQAVAARPPPRDVLHA